MCICKIEEIPAGVSQHYRGEPAGGQRAAFAVATIGRHADRQRANVALLTKCLVSISFLGRNHSTAVVAALLAALNLAILLDQQSLGADRPSGRLRYD